MISVVRESTSSGADRFTLSRAPFGSAGTRPRAARRQDSSSSARRPNSSASANQWSGPSAPRVEKRASASKACTLPSLTSTIGWAAIQMPSPLLRRSSAARAPSAPLEIGIPSYTPTVPGDERLATRSATSAAASSASAPVPSRGAVATPAQAEQPSARSTTAAMRRRAIRWASSENTRAANSSPPSRPSTSPSRSAASNVSAASTSTRSPTAWPSRLFTAPRPSRSSATSAIGRSCGRQPAEPVHLGAERPRREHAGERVVVGVVPRPAQQLDRLARDPPGG